jgi:hypothetical protein
MSISSTTRHTIKAPHYLRSYQKLGPKITEPTHSPLTPIEQPASQGSTTKLPPLKSIGPVTVSKPVRRTISGSLPSLMGKREEPNSFNITPNHPITSHLQITSIQLPKPSSILDTPLPPLLSGPSNPGRRKAFNLPPLQIPAIQSELLNPETTAMEVESPRPEKRKPVGILIALTTMLGKAFRQEPFKQRNIGDCYLLASFDAIQHHPAAESILNQIRIEEIPSTKEGEAIRYSVEFPSGKRAEFTADEIGMEKLGKKPLEGHRAWQILELAYSKATRNTRNRERKTPFDRDGEGHSPLILESGIAKNALYDMFGGEQQEITCEDTSFPWVKNTDTFDRNPQGRTKLISFLRNIEKDASHHYILAASSAAQSDTEDTIHLVRHQGGKSVSQSFPRSHAFSIREFDLDKGTITIANPHDTARKVDTLTLSEFGKVFWRISGIKIPAK